MKYIRVDRRLIISLCRFSFINGATAVRQFQITNPITDEFNYVIRDNKLQ